MKPAEMTRLMAGRPKILIVEDESDVRRLYAIGLNQRGFEVKLAANGAEAVERIANEKPDVILLDWVMPLMDGGEVLNKLSSQSNGLVSVIVISGQQPPDVFERGFFVLHDLASANGTYVNAKRVRVAPLTHGAKLRMGNTYGRFSEELPTED